MYQANRLINYIVTNKKRTCYHFIDKEKIFRCNQYTKFMSLCGRPFYMYDWSLDQVPKDFSITIEELQSYKILLCNLCSDSIWKLSPSSELFKLIEINSEYLFQE
jgi:hypothetical protein